MVCFFSGLFCVLLLLLDGWLNCLNYIRCNLFDARVYFSDGLVESCEAGELNTRKMRMTTLRIKTKTNERQQQEERGISVERIYTLHFRPLLAKLGLIHLLLAQ